MPTLFRPASALLGAAAAALLLSTTGCANADSAANARGATGYPSPSAGTAGPTGSVPALTGTTVVLRVDHTGGFVTPAMLATRLPMISVYADGRVITEGPQTRQYPGPALPNIKVQRIEAKHVDQLVERARTAGVRNGADLGQPSVADATTTRFTLLTEEGRQVTEAYALAEAEETALGLSKEQLQDRRLLAELITALQDLKGTLGTRAIQDPVDYVPTEIAAISWAYQKSEGDPAQQEKAWPGPALPGTSLGAGLDMGCVSADQLAGREILAAAADATAITPWTSGGKQWTVALRPLLPDEESCADLMKNS